MNDKVCEQPRLGPDLKQQINEKLGPIDRQIDNLSRCRMGGWRIVLSVCVGKEKPHQAEQIPAGVQRIVGAGPRESLARYLARIIRSEFFRS